MCVKPEFVKAGGEGPAAKIFYMYKKLALIYPAQQAGMLNVVCLIPH